MDDNVGVAFEDDDVMNVMNCVGFGVRTEEDRISEEPISDDVTTRLFAATTELDLSTANVDKRDEEASEDMVPKDNRIVEKVSSLKSQTYIYIVNHKASILVLRR